MKCPKCNQKMLLTSFRVEFGISTHHVTTNHYHADYGNKVEDKFIPASELIDLIASIIKEKEER